MGKKNKYKDSKENEQPKAQIPGQQTPAGSGQQRPSNPTDQRQLPTTSAKQAPKPVASESQRPVQVGGQSQQQPQQQHGQQRPAQPSRQQQQQQGQQRPARQGDHPGQQQQQSWGPPPAQQEQSGQRAQQQQPKHSQQQQGQQRPARQGGQPGQQQQQSWGPPSQQQQQQQQSGQRDRHQQSQQPQQQGQQRPARQGGQPGPQEKQSWGPPPQDQQRSGGWSQQGQAQGQQRQKPGGQQQQRPQGQGQRGPMPGQQQQPQQQQRQQSTGQQRPQQQQPQQRPLEQQFQEFGISDTASATSTSSSSSIQRGTLGKLGSCEANYLCLDLGKMPDTAFHYDITITPDRPKKFMRPVFEQFNRQFFPNIPMAYDGIKSFYTVQRIPSLDSGIEQSITYGGDSGGREIIFKVEAKATRDLEIDLRSLQSYRNDRVYDKPMRALQCLEVVLASSCHARGIRGGRSFYNRPAQSMPLGDGYELYTGLYQAMILGDEPFLNVDISHKSFPKEMSVLEFFDGNRNFNPHQPLATGLRYSLNDFLNNIRIVYRPPKCFGSFDKEYTVQNVSEEPANKKMFTLEDGTRKSVAEYFHGRGYKLQYPNLNCLIVGSTVKTIALPMELCFVKGGQVINKKDDPRQVSAMIKYAATSTNVRKQKIMDLLQRFEHNKSSIVQGFGIRIGERFVQVPMRLLSPPDIEYFGNQFARVRNGSWRMEDNMKYLETKPKQHKWAVLYSRESRSMNFTVLQKNLVEKLLIAAKGHNLDLNPKPFIDSFAQIDTKLNDLKKENYDLVVVVIPFRRPTYADIKKAAELKVGILTQCIKENTIERRCDMMLANNLLLKINAKLNGTNHKIDARTHIQLPNVMFIGADVTHPSPDQRSIPSVVGSAASHDRHGACYNMQYRLQPSTVENIEDMESIFTHHMIVYKKSLGNYPDHVIYYRDGVSDGQFKIVKQNELRSMRSASQKLGVKPKITCIIVVKRHHTRFFPTAPTLDRKFNNVDPGTVVDRKIVHPNEVQFFMVSHQSIQGTAKPTRYNVIEDDAQMDIDKMQRLTHNLCHLFPRCNRAVSYPTPVYLAHLVAFRGRVYLEGTQRFGDLKREYQLRQINPNFMVSNPMYFV